VPTTSAVLSLSPPVRSWHNPSSANPNYPNHRLLVVRAGLARGNTIELLVGNRAAPNSHLARCAIALGA
jgi:hypothetical protein